MGLSSSLYTGVSGLQGHGEKMGVIGNNIANISTVGFKGSRMHFEDFISQDVNTASGIGQVGRGVATGTVMADFQQGALETTSEATDVAIGGEGFFIVSPKGEEQELYTRAGNFRFDKDGFLVDPNGNVVQGWEVASRTVDVADGDIVQQGAAGVEIQGVPGDIRLQDFQSPPEATGNVTKGLNLDSRSPSRSDDLRAEWDPDDDPMIGDARYSYQSTIRVYDDNGTAHNLTTYFDAVDPDNLPAGGWIDGDDLEGGRRAWQFLVTVDPDSVTGDGGPDTGVVMNGALIFNAAGQLESIVMDDDEQGDPIDFSQNGYPLGKIDFLGIEDDDGDPVPQQIEINFGLRASRFVDPDADPLEVQDWERQANATTSFSSASTTIFQSQDGFTSGFLQNISIDRDGILTGRYSNGQVMELYALTLADFNNKWGLRREGSNLFSETRSSGPAITGRAGTGGLGAVAGNSLEMSNVDLAKEFVKMITTEKGFQANSKVITTTDQMLNVLIQMKR